MSIPDIFTAIAESAESERRRHNNSVNHCLKDCLKINISLVSLLAITDLKFGENRLLHVCELSKITILTEDPLTRSCS